MFMEILRKIENNAKLTTEELAIFLEKDVAEIAAEIERMEDAKIICGYHTLINWEKTERDYLTALIEINVTPARELGFDKIADRIYRYDEVKAVYLMSGGYDFMVIIEGKTMKDVAHFVTSKLAPLESVMSTATHFVLKKYKDHGEIFSDGKPVDERMVVSP